MNSVPGSNPVLAGNDVTTHVFVREFMLCFPTFEIKVISVFRHLKNSKCLDTNGLQTRPIRYVLDILAPLLKHIFHIALKTSTFSLKM